MKALGKGNISAKHLACRLRFDTYAFRLVAKVSQRDLVKETYMNRRTVQRALATLEATGLLQVLRRFNPQTQQYEINQYRAAFPPPVNEEGPPF